jgi:hypothetical protein
MRSPNSECATVAEEGDRVLIRGEHGGTDAPENM